MRPGPAAGYGWREMSRVALIVTALWLVFAGVAQAKTLSGDIPGAPAKAWSTALTVEAISAHDGTVRGGTRPSGSHWSMTVPAGNYLVAALLSDSHAGTAALVDEHLASAASLFPPRASSAAGGTVVGLGDVPIVPAAGAPLAPGGTATGGLVVGMLPVCDAKKAKLVDRTQQVQDAQAKEQQLSDEGLTPFKFAPQSLQPTISVGGKITLSNETAIADLKIVDSSTGKLIKHVVVRGDANDFKGDLDGFLTFVGKGVGGIACQPPKKKPKPKPKGSTIRYTIEYSGNYSDHAADAGDVHVDDLNLNWDEVLTATVSRTGAVRSKPMRLSLNGSVTVQNNTEGGSSSGQCILRPGSVPVVRGGYINLNPTAISTSSALRRYRTFEAWASIPETVSNGVVGDAPGSNSLCAGRTDLRPFGPALPPPSWDAVSLADVKGRWGVAINKPETASFTTTLGGSTDTVSVAARLRVTTSGTLR